MSFQLRTIVLSVLALSFVTFIALFGQVPAFRNTPISFIHRMIWVYIPNRLQRADASLTGGRVGAVLSGTGHYLMNEKHPLVVAFFLTLLFVCQLLFIPDAWSRLPLLHRILVPLLCALPYITLYLAVFSDPGFINSSNHHSVVRLYPYDHVLFSPGVECSTCRFDKPARSKHCSICKHCIAKEDHHCVWINNCVGRGNYHYFLLLLLSTGVLASYAAYLGHGLLSVSLQAASEAVPSLTDALHIKRQSGSFVAHRHWSAGLTWSDYFHVWGWAIHQDTMVGTVGLLCLLCSPLAWGLLAYHIYLIWAGMTTNESAKWSDWKADIGDGVVYMARRAPPEGGIRGVWRPVDQSLPWPVSSDQILTVSESGDPPRGRPPGTVSAGNGQVWTRVMSLREVDNIYDLGLWGNLRDIFVRRHL